MTELRELGHELLAKLAPQHPLLVKLWPLICRDRGWRLEEEISAEARARFCEAAGVAQPFSTKGEKASLARWMPVYRRIRHLQPDYHLKLLGFAMLAMERKWCTHYEELLAAKLPGMKSASAQEEQHASAAASSQAGGASSSSKAPPPQPPQEARGRQAIQKKARAELSQLTSKSKNNFHAAARLHADPEGYTLECLLELVMRPWVFEHSKSASDFKTIDGSVSYFVSMADGGWHTAIWGCVRNFMNLPELGKAGLTVDFSPSLKARLTEENDEVIAEDCLAKSFWRLALCVIGERACSISLHTDCYPLNLALLLDDTKAQEGLDKFKQRWEAYAGARSCGLPDAIGLADRCSLNARRMEQFARHARAPNYKPNEKLKQMAYDLFAAIGQEKIVEDLNQRQVDAQTRDATSHSIGVWKCWETSINSGLLEQYGRRPLEVNMAMDINVRDDYDDIFNPSSVTEETLEKLDLASVMKDRNWVSMNSTSLRRTASEMQLVVHVHKRNDWTLLGEAWHFLLFPLREVVLAYGEGEAPLKASIVLATTEFGVLTYPVRRVGDKNFALGGEGSRC